MVSLVLGAKKVTLVRQEQQAQQDQLATCHYLDHRDHLVIKAHLGPEAAQVHSTRLFPNVFISNDEIFSPWGFKIERYCKPGV